MCVGEEVVACRSFDYRGRYSSVVERQSCKLKVLGLIPSGGYAFLTGRTSIRATPARKLTLAGLEPAIFGSEDQRLIH